MTNTCYCRRDDLALINVSGADARQFLHAQTTQNIADLPPDEARLAAWLTPKGRVLALFDVVPDGESFWLMTAADNAGWLVERMRLFVLRSDVVLEVAAESAVWSVWGDVTAWLATRDIDLDPGFVARQADSLWLRSGEQLVHVIVHGDAPAGLFAAAQAESAEHAAAVEIAAGRPALPAALRDRYVPQMLDLDRLDAISFSKGCYPGQEIVARTHNLGQVKRRLARFGIEDGARPLPGAEIVDESGQATGEVVRTAPGTGGYEVLAVVPIDTAERSLALAADGRTLIRRDLAQAD
ncbi:MAG TPA: hypothetical protein VIV64_06065 [Gammaproteobacteria bacterium]|jgi:folate-binding protein YgfZ